MKDKVMNATRPALELGRNVYLAGLGIATTVADQYSNAFSSLVDKGRARNEKRAEEKGENEKKSPKVVTIFKDYTEKTGEKLQDGVNSALNRIGIPSKQEIRDLTKSIEQLTEKVQAMQASA